MHIAQYTTRVQNFSSSKHDVHGYKKAAEFKVDCKNIDPPCDKMHMKKFIAR
jgi:hypothetical protein